MSKRSMCGYRPVTTSMFKTRGSCCSTQASVLLHGNILHDRLVARSALRCQKQCPAYSARDRLQCHKPMISLLLDPKDNSSAVFGFNLTHVIRADLQDETCFTILVSVPMIQSTLRCPSSTPPWNCPCAHTSSHRRRCSKSLALWYAFGSIASAVPSSAHEYFVAKNTLATIVRLSLLQNEL